MKRAKEIAVVEKKGSVHSLRCLKQGLGGCAWRKEQSSKALGRHVQFADELSRHTNDSSKATESNEEATRASMMNLEIACNHMQQ